MATKYFTGNRLECEKRIMEGHKLSQSFQFKKVNIANKSNYYILLNINSNWVPYPWINLVEVHE
ncbi:MAG: hypothetical protein DWQ05_04280 [Calditrichaeota bacterium]|nr:MAG: hypothetical protein DWQ05_04280 [Calditrichota bacterium]